MFEGGQVEGVLSFDFEYSDECFSPRFCLLSLLIGELRLKVILSARMGAPPRFSKLLFLKIGTSTSWQLSLSFEAAKNTTEIRNSTIS